MSKKKAEPTGAEFLADKLVEMDTRIALLEKMLMGLAEANGTKLEKRQVDGGWQMMWMKDGRIVLP